jgi:hypothetical protein
MINRQYHQNRKGFGEVWLFQSSGEPKLMDIYISEVRAKVKDSPSLILFRELKEKYKLSQYLLIFGKKT